jgi:hypothetical protein
MTVTAKGYNGTATLDRGMVTITRTGFAARTLIGSGSRAIPVSRIAVVQFVPARVGFRGFIQFTIAGDIEQRAAFGRRTAAAHHDENTVVFARRQQGQFEQLRDAIQRVIAYG